MCEQGYLRGSIREQFQLPATVFMIMNMREDGSRAMTAGEGRSYDRPSLYAVVRERF